MRRAFQSLIVLGAALGFGACFNFGDYSFPDDQAAVGGSTAVPGGGGSTAGTAGTGAGGSGAPGGAGGDASRCLEDPSACQVQQVVARERGSVCLSAIDCNTAFCVDGVCCEEACEGSCAACNVPGQLGFCLGIPNDDDCQSGCLPSSACLEYRPSEAVTAGNCASRGVCRPNGDCARFPLPKGTPCGDLGGTCDGSGACGDAKKKLGETCASADECSEGFCAATAAGTRVCCNQACDQLCQQCSPLGTCSEAPAIDARCPSVTCGTDDVCNDYPPTPEVARCAGFGVCVAGEVCAPVALRPASECACTAAGCSLVLGAHCSLDEDCDSGFCAGGVCCKEACDGSCEQCDSAGQCGRASSCECTPGATTTCGSQFNSVGDCAARSITCDDSGQWPNQRCRAQGPELCDDNDRDEDCNGDPRNGCDCLNGTLGSCRLDLGAQGVCADLPAIECQDGHWPAARCAPTSDEICRNNRDDNCDGRVDEQPPCGVFDPSACDFTGRPECDAKRCTRCNGCQDCVDIVECVAATSPLCVTTADPVCGTNSCIDQVANGNANAFEDFQPTESAREYIECVCAR